MTRDEFDLWSASPVTRWVFTGLANAMAQEKAEWLRVSWDASPPDGKTSPALLIQLRSRHDALEEVVDNTYEQWSEWNGDEPERD